MILNNQQLGVLRVVLRERILSAGRMTREERAAARGLAHRKEPLLEETPFHLWHNPEGPTYRLTKRGEVEARR